MLPTWLGVQVAIDIASFRGQYAKRPRNSEIECEPHELVKLDAGHGVRTLGRAPAQSVCFGRPRLSREDSGEYTYLWVMDDSGIPYIIEQPLPLLDGFCPKHTNLTGGADAYLGGEIWFSDAVSLFLSGGSGRYPPLHETQLNDAVQVFESYGYEVTSLGWNVNGGYAERIHRVS